MNPIVINVVIRVAVFAVVFVASKYTTQRILTKAAANTTNMLDEQNKKAINNARDLIKQRRLTDAKVLMNRIAITSEQVANGLVTLRYQVELIENNVTTAVANHKQSFIDRLLNRNEKAVITDDIFFKDTIFTDKMSKAA